MDSFEFIGGSLSNVGLIDFKSGKRDRPLTFFFLVQNSSATVENNGRQTEGKVSDRSPREIVFFSIRITLLHSIGHVLTDLSNIFRLSQIERLCRLFEKQNSHSHLISRQFRRIVFQSSSTKE